MKYLWSISCGVSVVCVSETLQKYPPAGILFRETSRPYTIPGIGYNFGSWNSVIHSCIVVALGSEIFPRSREIRPGTLQRRGEVRKLELHVSAFRRGTSVLHRSERNLLSEGSLIHPFVDISGNRFGLQQVKVALTAQLS